MSYSLPVQVLFGLYLGALTGVVPALVAWTLGFVFRYVTGVSVPGFGVVVLCVAIAGVQGGLLGLLDPAIGQSPIIVVALVVVMLSSQYAHAKGDSMGATFPAESDFGSYAKTACRATSSSASGGSDRSACERRATSATSRGIRRFPTTSERPSPRTSGRSPATCPFRNWNPDWRTDFEPTTTSRTWPSKSTRGRRRR